MNPSPVHPSSVTAAHRVTAQCTVLYVNCHPPPDLSPLPDLSHACHPPPDLSPASEAPLVTGEAAAVRPFPSSDSVMFTVHCAVSVRQVHSLRLCKGQDTLCVLSAQSRTRSSEIVFLRTVIVCLSMYVYSLPAEHCFRLRKNAISDERVRDCAPCTHSVFRP